MSTKKELQLMLKTLGYELNPYTSKDTLLNFLHLHSNALQQGINVPKMDDHVLRCFLNEYNVLTGPLIGHTRAIYQRQLLKAITNDINKGMDDKVKTNNEKCRTLSIKPKDGMVTRSGKVISYNIQ